MKFDLLSDRSYSDTFLSISPLCSDPPPAIPCAIPLDARRLLNAILNS